MAAAITRQHHVIGFGTVNFVDVQFGPRPVDSIFAFGNTGNLRIKVVFRLGHAAVIEPVGIAVLQHGFISAIQPFPRLIEPEHDFARLWAMQDEPDAVQRSNQMMINEQLTTRTDVDGLRSLHCRCDDEHGKPSGGHRMV